MRMPHYGRVLIQTKKGRELEKILAVLPVSIGNINSENYRNIRGTTHVDVTLVGDEMCRIMSDWRYLPTPSLSDHQYIFFKLTLNINKSVAQNSYRLPSYEDINMCMMKNVLSELLQQYVNINNIESEVDMHKEISDLAMCIRKSAYKCKFVTSVIRNMPWLTRELYVVSSRSLPSVNVQRS